MIPTVLITLLAFLVDVLLFAPHLAWGSYVVLAAFILIVISGVLTCAMRRTIVSRKARKKRIAENAEMSGENFYHRQNAPSEPVSSPPPLSQQPSAPMVNGAPGANNLPAFATFENKSSAGEDDRTPLNAYSRTGTGVSGSTTVRPSMELDGMERYGPGAARSNLPPLMGRGGLNNGLRNEDGTPLVSSGTLISADEAEYAQRRPSNESMGHRGRGRGGFPARGYGRGGPGGPGGRGGMPMGTMAAGAGAGMMAGEMMGRGRGPPPGYSNPYGQPPPGRQGPLPPGSYNAAYAGPGPYGRHQSPGPPSAPGYGRRQSPGPPSAPGYGRQPSPGPPSAPGAYNAAYGYGARQPTPPEGRFGRAESPPPLPIHHPPQQLEHEPAVIGQAIEMDEHTGSPANPPSPTFGIPMQMQPLRDSDSEVQGLVGLQRSREAEQLDSHISGAYSSQQEQVRPNSYSAIQANSNSYVPPRTAWEDGPARTATPPRTTGTPVADRRSPPKIHESSVPAPSKAQMSSDDYYEDVDPRFVDQAPRPNIPTVLMPGGQMGDPYVHDTQPRPLQTTPSYDSVQDGPSSENSNFTSISERGVNPQWQAEHRGYATGGVPNRGPPPQQQRDFLLVNNPDFELPAGRDGRGPGRGGRGGMPMGGMI
ncbi:MAG: hypothetical protein LQ340_000304 [Diploschistes diacapsis]|nr:MAG: hypothetical protein LQ340_000304 [Diploschistes diacapsis]